MGFEIHYSCISHAGRVRAKNQDNFICSGSFLAPDAPAMEAPLAGTVNTKTPAVFGVFDGMGGEECGEAASRIAAENASRLRLGPHVPGELSRFLRKVNREICGYVITHDLRSMGTTAVMAAFSGAEATLCSIGDSRIYRYSEGQLQQLSEDHVSPAPYGRKPQLLQYLGIPYGEMIIEPWVSQEKLRQGDRYLLCSDGLTDELTPEKIGQILDGGSVDEGVRALLQAALDHGGKDNVSILLCEVGRKRLF